MDVELQILKHLARDAQPTVSVQNPKNEAIQKKAKRAINLLKVISDGLEPAAKLVQAGKDLIPALAAWFGL